MEPPDRVRVYRQHNYFRLQWWDPRAGRNLSDRVDGDLLAALIRAREIDQQLDVTRTSGPGIRKLRHDALVEAFVADLHRRADAGEIDPRTVARYRTALAHYVDFCRQPAVTVSFALATHANRELALGFAAFLKNRTIQGAGSRPGRRITEPRYIEDIVRAMFAWGADPDRGGLLPAGFRNPFAGRRSRTDALPADPLRPPDISIEMAAELLRRCDAWQLPIFSLYALYGLRASEPTWIFGDEVSEEWLTISCHPEFEHWTKGRRDKRLPLDRRLAPLWASRGDAPAGLQFRQRQAAADRKRFRGVTASREALASEFATRCRSQALSATQRRLVRDRLHRDAGGLNYDTIDREFRRIARGLGWPAACTLKDFRHAFATALQNAGMPDLYRRYLMGHALGRTALLSYTHLDQLREAYQQAGQRHLAPLVDAALKRGLELGLL